MASVTGRVNILLGSIDDIIEKGSLLLVIFLFAANFPLNFNNGKFLKILKTQICTHESSRRTLASNLYYIATHPSHKWDFYLSSLIPPLIP